MVPIALLLGLTGCTAAVSASGVAPAEDSRVMPQAPEQPDAPQHAPEDERQVARTGSLTLRTGDVARTAAQLRALVAAHAGFVASEQLSLDAGDDAGTSTIVLSVPSDALARVMDEAAKTGELVTRNVTAQDVTDRIVDVEARIRTLRESIARVRALMSRAGSISELAQVESELTRRQSDLEALLAKQAALKGQVERAPVIVTLVRPGQPDPGNPLLDGLLKGWEALQRSLVALVTVIGAVLPFAVVGAVIAWPLLRRFRRRPTGGEAPETKADES